MENKLTTFDDIEYFIDNHIINNEQYVTSDEKDGTFFLCCNQFARRIKYISLSTINECSYCTFNYTDYSFITLTYKSNRKKIISEILK